MVQRWYNHQSANNQPFVGIHVFFRHGILVRDPELIKQVMVKDFNKFSNRSSGADIHNDTLASANIFFAKNPEWRTIRQKLTPVFTSKVRSEEVERFH
uniref:Cytochrome P450 n=1 Tax=Megaselia scalaris TaxID=36166 RepID=T1GZC1_MEGSC